MSILRPDDVRELTGIFSVLGRDVTVKLVTDDLEMRMLMQEIADTAGGKIKLEKLPETSQDTLGLTQTPAMVLSSDTSKGRLHFYGAPLGYDMAALVAGIVDLGGTDADLLSADTAAQLATLDKDVHIQVFSTPT